MVKFKDIKLGLGMIFEYAGDLYIKVNRSGMGFRVVDRTVVNIPRGGRCVVIPDEYDVEIGSMKEALSMGREDLCRDMICCDGEWRWIKLTELYDEVMKDGNYCS